MTNVRSFFNQSISESGDMLYMSDKAGGCARNQTPTVKQSEGSGTLTLTKQSESFNINQIQSHIT